MPAYRVLVRASAQPSRGSLGCVPLLPVAPAGVAAFLCLAALLPLNLPGSARVALTPGGLPVSHCCRLTWLLPKRIC